MGTFIRAVDRSVAYYSVDARELASWHNRYTATMCTLLRYNGSAFAIMAGRVMRKSPIVE